MLDRHIHLHSHEVISGRWLRHRSKIRANIFPKFVCGLFLAISIIGVLWLQWWRWRCLPRRNRAWYTEFALNVVGGLWGSIQIDYAQSADTSFLKRTRCCHCGALSSGFLIWMNWVRNTTSSPGHRLPTPCPYTQRELLTPFNKNKALHLLGGPVPRGSLCSFFSWFNKMNPQKTRPVEAGIR